MEPGVLVQIGAYGEQNCYLNGNPQISNFKCVYSRYNNFNMCQIRQYLHGRLDFGQLIYCEIGKIGDLVGDLFFETQLPSLGIVRQKSGFQQLEWVNNIGTRLIEEYYITIGDSNNIIERNYSQWMDIWAELFVPTSQTAAYNKLVGKTDNPTNIAGIGEGPINLSIPLSFWFNRNRACALPLICLQDTSVRIYIKLRPFRECVVPVNADTDFANLENYFNSCCPNPLKSKTYVWSQYYFLDAPERRKFLTAGNSTGLNYLIDQLQVLTFSEIPQKIYIPVNMEFTFPISMLAWTIQRVENIEQNYWLNYSKTIGEIAEGDTLKEGRLQLDGQDVIQNRGPLYFSTVVPFQFFRNYPKNKYIYYYSFASNPTEPWQPSGVCNFSMLDSKTLQLVIEDELLNSKELIITVWARNYNILKIKGGFASTVYLS